jgi:hypothetical protein
MKRILMGSGLAAVVGALALAPGAGAATPDGSACAPTTGTVSCQWQADVNGEYGVAGASWKVEKWVCDAQTPPVCGWSVIAHGAGAGADTSGSLAKGGTYRLTVTSGGGALGSITGNGTV